ncbi:hypothetical protein [Methanosarcina sp. UBA5]|uniref:hypothetical protein n=1 Tax=Methanosarcina sp. UBA5 TaxID=1915593 RepID=UPI0025E2719B|nr:hypothetical protein [Methanosarcina sp. UBA5]
MAVTVSVVVPITETVPSRISLIYAYGSLDEEFWIVDAETVDDARIKKKTRAVNAKIVEFNFSLVFISYSTFTI